MHDPKSLSDIVVAGAGLVGTPLAQVLASQGWSVVLLDASPGRNVSGEATQDGVAVKQVIADPGVAAVHYEKALRQRCTALSLGTQRWFARHKLWHAIVDDAAAIVQVAVSHKGYFGATRLRAEELGVNALGYVVNNEHFTRSLQQQLQQSTVDYRRDARVVSVQQHHDHVQIKLENAEPVRARLLIAADGVSSIVRESVGIASTQVDYDQAAVLGTLKLQARHEGVAYERFTPSGPLALLPRIGAYMSFVDCIDPSERERVAQLDDAHYLERLQERFGYRLGRFEAVGPRLVIPLVRIEATQQTAERTVLLGNAMRLLHPVGGQGYNLAMRDVDQLVRLLSDSRVVDPGKVDLLDEFVRTRRDDQKRTVQFTDALARSFRGKASLPGHLRSAALLGLDTLAPVRNQFARRTMGLVNH